METVTVLKAGGMSLGGAGVVGATGYGVYEFTKPSTIGEKLVQEGNKLIDKENIDKWKELSKIYPTKDSVSKKLDEATSLSQTEEVEKANELRDKCEKTLKIKLNGEGYTEEKMEAARLWCVTLETTSSANQ